MTVLLCGGGDERAVALAVQRMREAVVESGRSSARIGVLAAADDPGTAWLLELFSASAQLPGELMVLPAIPSSGDVLGLAGLIVPDAAASAQLLALADVVGDVRGLVHRGASYLGIGSGAMIAAETVLLGGSEIGGIPVAPETDDPEAEIEAVAGLGLIDLTVLPHAARSGRIGAAIAACEAELTDRVIGLDDGLTLVISEGSLAFLGRGSCWQITRTDDGVTVTTSRAAS